MSLVTVFIGGNEYFMDEETNKVYNLDGSEAKNIKDTCENQEEDDNWEFGDSYDGDEYDEEMEIFIMTAYFEGEEYQFEDWDESDIKHWTSLESDKKIKENEVEPAGWRMVEGKRIRKLARIATQ
jgi:hypothetical protein